MQWASQLFGARGERHLKKIGICALVASVAVASGWHNLRSRQDPSLRPFTFEGLTHSLGIGHPTCRPCSKGDAICERWGHQALLRSRDYVGSGRQFAPFIDRLHRGGNLSLGILGGSVSSCHDVDESVCYPSVLARRIGERFGVLPAVFNGAVGATGSDFFASCWDIRIPTDVDLVVVEVSINDGGKNAFINKDLTQVLRSLMSLPDPPAILLLDVYSPFVAWWYGGSVGVRVLGPYFDVPVISHQNVLYHHRHALTTPAEYTKWWTIDAQQIYKMGHHPTALGHDLMADLLLSYILEQSCLARHGDIVGSGGGEGIVFPDIPKWDPWEDLNHLGNDEENGPIRGMCQSADEGPKQLVPQAGSRGTEFDVWNGKAFIRTANVGDVLVLEGTLRHKEVAVFFWRSRSLGLGTAKCWLNDGESEAKTFDGWWSMAITVPFRLNIAADPALIGRTVRLTCKVVEPPPRLPGTKLGTEMRWTAVAW